MFLALLVVLVEEEALAWGLPRVLSELWFWDPCFWDSDLFLSGSGGVAMRSLVNRSGLTAGQGQTRISYHPWGQHGSHDVVWVTPSPSPNISHTTPLRPQTPFIWG